MNYSFEPAKEEAHCISVWGKDAQRLCDLTNDEIWLLKPEVKDWFREHSDLVQSVLGSGNDLEDNAELVYTFRFKTKDAAMLFKLTFGGNT